MCSHKILKSHKLKKEQRLKTKGKGPFFFSSTESSYLSVKKAGGMHSIVISQEKRGGVNLTCH